MLASLSLHQPYPYKRQTHHRGVQDQPIFSGCCGSKKPPASESKQQESKPVEMPKTFLGKIRMWFVQFYKILLADLKALLLVPKRNKPETPSEMEKAEEKKADKPKGCHQKAEDKSQEEKQQEKPKCCSSIVKTPPKEVKSSCCGGKKKSAS